MTYREIIDYFDALAVAHVDIKESFHGDYEQILNAQKRASFQYPILWIESPTARISGNADSKTINWDCALVVLANKGSNKSFEIKSDNIDTAYAIAMEIIGKMINDQSNGVIHQLEIPSIEIDLVWSENNDDSQGWRIQFTFLTKESLLCYNDNKWS